MEYSKKDVVRVTGLAPRLVQFYTESGVVTPVRFEGEGRGGVRYYSRYQLLEFAIIDVLAKNGTTIQRIREIIEFLRGTGINILDIWQKTISPVYLNIYQLTKPPIIIMIETNHNKKSGFVSVLTINLKTLIERMRRGCSERMI